ncbi:hypothetical protein BKA83DRAFT_4125062 [Pisolithus microcarpus]|nr:hypothetical protein BKA83DRAFT_4128918 [Pisolithus microcarpus]KAI6023494.1 hypothetical protein BKA83DRAFT_4125062 [Pisolithus microcarpus]
MAWLVLGTVTFGIISLPILTFVHCTILLLLSAKASLSCCEREVMGVVIQVVDDPQGLATANLEHGEQPGKIHVSGGGATDWKGCLLVSARPEPEGDRWLAVEIQTAWKNSGQTLNRTFRIDGVIWTWSRSCLESPQIDTSQLSSFDGLGKHRETEGQQVWVDKVAQADTASIPQFFC